MNVSRLFMEEVRDKKRTAIGVHHKTGKRGYVGKLYTTSDLLKGKAKREYQGTGKVVSYNMYDTMVNFTEFSNMSEEDQKRHLIKYRERHSNKEIMQEWGIDHNRFYRLINDLNVPKEHRNNTKNKSNQSSKVPNKVEYLTTNKEKIEAKKHKEPKEKEDGMTLSLSGEYSSEELVRKLEKFGLILSDEESKFSIKLKITEI